MPRLFPFYPDGVPGLGLLLIRFACALIVFPALARVSSAPPDAWPMEIPFALMVLAFVTGFLARLAALLLLAALCGGLLASWGESIPFLLSSAAVAGSLALQGPGAYSIDAHRFGRRVIRLDPRSPERGKDG